MSNISQLEQRLTDLSLQTFERKGTKMDMFNPLQQVEAIAHDLNELGNEDFIAASSLLFSESFPHNSLDFLELALKSTELSKDLIEARMRLHEALGTFITKSGAVGVQDHLIRIRKLTINWIRKENSAKTKQSCLRPLQSALENPLITFPSDFEAVPLASVLKDTYQYGKATEFVSPGVKGTILSTLGLLCTRFPKEFSEAERNVKETLSQALRRLCIATLEEQLTEGGKDPMPALQSGALNGLNHALRTSPCDYGSESKEANRIYTCARKCMKITPDLRRFEVPFQAISLILCHANLFGPQIMKEPDVLFDEFRNCVHSKHERLKKISFRACIEVLRTISLSLGGGADVENEEGIDDDEGGIDEGEMAYFKPSTSTSNAITIEAATKTKLLNSFMKRFSEYIQNGLKTESDKERRRAVRKDVDLAIHGYGLFAGAVVSLTDEGRLRFVLFKLFELSDKLDAMLEDGKDEEQQQQQQQYSTTDQSSPTNNSTFDQRRYEFFRINEKEARRVRFLLAYARISHFLSSSVLNQESVMDRFSNEIISLSSEYRRFPDSLAFKLSSAISKLLQGLSNKGSSLQTILSRIIFPLEIQSISDQAITMDEEFIYEDFWLKLLPVIAQNNNPSIQTNLVDSQLEDIEPTSTHSSRAKLATELVFDHMLSVALKIIPKLNLECVVSEVESLDLFNNSASSTVKEEEENVVSGAMIHSTERMVPKSLDDLKMFHNLTRLLEKLLKKCEPQNLLRWLPTFVRIVSEGIQKNPLLSSWYRLMGLAFSTIEVEGEEKVDEATYFCLNNFIETCALRSKQYTDELLATSLGCILKTPKGRLLDTHLKNLVPCLIAALKMGLSHPPVAQIAMDELERWIRSTQYLSLYFPVILPELAAYISPSTRTNIAATTQQDQESGFVVDEEAAKEEENLKRRWRQRKTKSKKKTTLTAKETQVPLDIRSVQILGRIGGNNRFVLPPLSEVLTDAKCWDPIKRLEISLPLGSFVIDVKIDAILPLVTSLARTSTHRQTKVAACEMLHALVLVMVGTSATSRSIEPNHFLNLYNHLFPELLQLAVDVEPVTRQLFRPLIAQLSRWFARGIDQSDDKDRKEGPETGALLDAAIEALGDKSNGALRELAAETLGIFFRWTFKSTANASQDGKKKVKVDSHSTLNVTFLLQRLYSLMRHPDPYKRLGSTLAFEAFYRDFREESSIVSDHALQFLENGVVALRIAHSDPVALGTTQAASSMLQRLLRIISQKHQDLMMKRDGRPGFPDLEAAVGWLFTLCAATEKSLRSKAQEMFEVLCAKLAPNESECEKFLVEYCRDHMKDIELPTIPELSEFPSNHMCEKVFDAATAVIDFNWWLLRRKLVKELKMKDECFSLIQRMTDLIIKKALQKSDSTLLPSRAASSLCNFLRCSALFASYFPDIDQPSLWRSLIITILKPTSVGLDNDERELKFFFPGAVQQLIKSTKNGAKKATSILTDFIYEEFPSCKLENLDFTGKSDTSSLLRGVITLVRSGVKFDDAEAISKQVVRLPFGSGPQALRDGSTALRLCFEMGWSSLIPTLLNVDVLEESTTTIGFTFFKHFQEDILSHLSKNLSNVGSLLVAVDPQAPTEKALSVQAYQVMSKLCDYLVSSCTTKTN